MRRPDEPWRQRFHSTGESSLSSPEEESSSSFSRSPLEDVEESSEDNSSFSSGHEWPTSTTGSDCSGEEPAKVSFVLNNSICLRFHSMGFNPSRQLNLFVISQHGFKSI